MMKNRIISDYLESLKEDNELDYIFPILLSSMGFRIVSTPRNSKGQPQHGKDVVAIGRDSNNIVHRWYFELKGNAAKDITISSFSAPDGIKESLDEAKYVAYNAPSIPTFDSLPVKIVFVHNGILQANAEELFNGYINKEFPDGNFERWGIERLTELFSEHLFEECMFANEKCYSLFKKTIVLLDAPGWTTKDVDSIIDIHLSQCPTGTRPNRRLISKTFAGLNLMLAIIHKFSIESGNLLPAKQSSDRIVLKVWSWILKNHKESSKLYLEPYCKIVDLHLTIYQQYVDKLLPLAMSYKGLYLNRGYESEKICYPLRCYDFLNDLLYFFFACDRLSKENEDMRFQQLECIVSVITRNSGFDIPLTDNCSITLLLLTKFIVSGKRSENVEQCYVSLISRICQNVIIRHKQNGMFPEVYNNIRELCKSIYHKSDNYSDSSSMFLLVLVEIIVWLDIPELYSMLRHEITESKVNLQIPFPIESDDLEETFFDHHLHNEMSVKTNIELPESFQQFIATFEKKYKPIAFKTANSRLDFLVILAHIHYKTEMFPDFINFGFLKSLDESSMIN